MLEECESCGKDLLRCKCTARDRVQLMIEKRRFTMKEQLNKLFKRGMDLEDSETEEADQDRIL